MPDFLFDQGKNKIEGSPKTRIDSIDTELQNVRIGADGETYATAGEAVRKQFKDINNEVNACVVPRVDSINIFDPTQEVYTGKVYTGDNEMISNANYDSTVDFIDVGENSGGEYIYPFNYPIRALLQYDSTKTFISIVNNIGVSGTQLNSSCRYIKVSFATGKETEYLLSIGKYYGYFEPYHVGYYLTNDIVINDKSLVEKYGVGMQIIPNNVELLSSVIFDQYGSIVTGYNAYSSTKSFIPVIPKQTYTVFGKTSETTTILLGLRACIYYDKNKQYISGFSVGTGLPSTITTPDNCYYIRFTYLKAYDGIFYLGEGNAKQNLAPTYNYKFRILPNLLPFNNIFENSFFGQKIAGLGDSITQADGCEAGWIVRTANYFGMKSFNYGINGSTIAVKESDPTTRYPMVTRYESMDDNIDIVVVLGGSNDWYYAWTPVGTMDDRTNYTFYGALHNLIAGLIEKYENGKVVFVTPIKRGNNPTAQNSNGYTLKQYCDIIKEVCAYYGVPCLDANSFCQLAPFIEWQNTKYFLEVSSGGQYVHDYTHPNDAGHEKIANYLCGQLKTFYK